MIRAKLVAQLSLASTSTAGTSRRAFCTVTPLLWKPGTRKVQWITPSIMAFQSNCEPECTWETQGELEIYAAVYLVAMFFAFSRAFSALSSDSFLSTNPSPLHSEHIPEPPQSSHVFNWICNLVMILIRFCVLYKQADKPVRKLSFKKNAADTRTCHVREQER